MCAYFKVNDIDWLSGKLNILYHFFLDDDYQVKNIPPEAEELSFEVSYSEMVTEAPRKSKFKKSDFKKEDYVFTVS